MIDKTVDRETISKSPRESEIVISIEEISKKFCRDLKRSLFYGACDIATDLVGGQRRSSVLRDGEFWALKDISFQLQKGEALGLVGTNGAGKSTLLKILSGLIKPDRGSARIRGRLAPLIALGAGFNPILTGRENIYANMSILGLSTSEITKRFDDVIDFAEIWEAIDAPVQSYSSGMAARLGFACAIYTEPDILLIDEVLAVGDIKFRAKCYRRLHELRQQGTSFILVNHNPQAILNICDTTVYLSQGQLIAAGDTQKVIDKYQADLFIGNVDKQLAKTFIAEKSPSESLGVDICSLFFRDPSGEIIDSLVSGQAVNFCVGCKVHRKVERISLHLKIKKLSGEGSLGTVLFLSGEKDDIFWELSPGKHEVQLKMPYLSLEPGSYTMSIKIKQESVYTFDVFESFKFIVNSDGTMSDCRFYQPRSWNVAKVRETSSD